MSASESTTPRLYAKAIAVPQQIQLRAVSAELFRRVLGRIEFTADFLTCAAGMFAAYALEASIPLAHHSQYPARPAVAASILVGFSSALFFAWSGAYRGGGSLLRISETERALRIPALSILLLLAFSLLLDLKLPPAAALIALAVIPVQLILQKLTFVSVLRTAQSAGFGVDRTVIYGAGNATKRVVSALFQSPQLGLLPVAAIDDHCAGGERSLLEMGYRWRHSVPVQKGPVTPEALKALHCSVLIVALPGLSLESRNAAQYAAKHAGVRLAFLSGLELQKQSSTQSIDLDGLSLTTGTPNAPWHYTIAKRLIDLFGALLLLMLLSPLLFLIALIIQLDSSGPALFVQKRVGRNGELFNIYKFRSMYPSAPRYDFSPSATHDLRVTRVGRFIRQTSLDELPQLINVLLGNMSLVGPRPEMPFIVQDYAPEHRQRLQVLPGITGLWQLSADRALPIHENIEYDLYYIRHRGIFMDIAILIHTLFFAIRREG